MTERLYLPRRYREQIEALLREHVPGVEVWAYGSRVNGRSHEGSDLDLVLRGPDLQRIPGDHLLDLTEALEESNIPILVQAHDWAGLPESFHREIEREYVVLVGADWDKEATLMNRPTEVHPRAGYRIWLRYSDGVAGEIDLSQLAGKGVFKVWDEPGYFEKVHITSHRTIAWDDDLDLCADALYMELTGKSVEEVMPGVKRIMQSRDA